MNRTKKATLIKPQPYFYARKGANGFITRGTQSCKLGHIVNPGEVELDGIFAMWKWNGRKLTVRNDRYGMFPLFYYHYGPEICISPSLSTLLKNGATTEVDRAALAVFFHLGYFIGEDTPFKHIKVLPPNAILNWNGDLSISSNRPVARESKISRDEAIDTYIHLFEEAIQKRLTPNLEFALPLTGGRDSRHILFALVKAGARPKYCITSQLFPPENSGDVRTAKALTSMLKLRHVVVKPTLSKFSAELRKNTVTHFCSFQHAWLCGIADYMQHGIDVFYDGIGGDVLSAGMGFSQQNLNLFKEGRFWDLAESLLGPGIDPLECTVIPEFYHEEPRNIARQLVIRELKKHADTPDPRKMFIFWNRTRRMIALAPFAYLNQAGTAFCPYLDNQLFDFLASLPPDLVSDKNFHTDTISRAYQEYAHIPYSETYKTTHNKVLSRILHKSVFAGSIAQYVLCKGYRFKSFLQIISKWARVSCSKELTMNLKERRRYATFSNARLLYLIQLKQLCETQTTT